MDLTIEHQCLLKEKESLVSGQNYGDFIFLSKNENKSCNIIRNDHKLVDIQFNSCNKKLQSVLFKEKSIKEILRRSRCSNVGYLKHCPHCWEENQRILKENKNLDSVNSYNQCIRCGIPILKYVGLKKEDHFCTICAAINTYDQRRHSRCKLHTTGSGRKSGIKGQPHCYLHKEYSVCSFNSKNKKSFFAKKKILANEEIIMLNNSLRYEFLSLFDTMIYELLFFSEEETKKLPGIKLQFDSDIDKKNLFLTEEEKEIIENLTDFLDYLHHKKQEHMNKTIYRFPKSFKLGKTGILDLKKMNQQYVKEFKNNLIDVIDRLIFVMGKQLLITKMIINTKQNKELRPKLTGMKRNINDNNKATHPNKRRKIEENNEGDISSEESDSGFDLFEKFEPDTPFNDFMEMGNNEQDYDNYLTNFSIFENDFETEFLFSQKIECDYPSNGEIWNHVIN